MHNETIQCNKVKSIVVSIVSISIALYLFELIQFSIHGHLVIVHIAAIILPILTIMVLLNEVIRCITAYKYSIIGDKLIINKISGRNINNEESIRIDNIIYLGERSKMPKKYFRLRNHKYHTELFCRESKTYCVYKINDRIIKFSFTPSTRLVSLVNKKNHKMVKVEA